MKKLLKFLITKILVFRAKYFLRRHRMQVIAVTGSIGKSSTKQAIYTVLKPYFSVYASKEGFNTELGMSLAICQVEESGFSSMRRWFKILRRVFFEKKQVYQKLILEMGADHPGDIARLVKVARPSIGIVTAVAPVHLENGQFKDIQQIAHEKAQLVASLPRGGIAILNDDDLLTRVMTTPATKLMYGTQASADLRASDIVTSSRQIRFRVHFKDESVPFDAPVLGSFQVYTLLPAIAVGLSLGLTLEQCAKALYQFHLPPGRMNFLDGVNKSHIIDSSYNSSPVTASAALRLLRELKAERKIAAIGTMNELGDLSKEAHLVLGKEVAQSADMLVAVGPEAATIKKGAMEAGMQEEKIYTFLDSEEAGNFLKKELRPKDLVLVKGSQNRVRMEKLVKVIMVNPEKAPELLCRQDEEWDKI